MSCTPESAIQSFDTGQQIHCVPYFDSCQYIDHNIDVQYQVKYRLHYAVDS